MEDRDRSLLKRLEDEREKYADNPKMQKHVTRIHTRIVEMRIAEKRKRKAQLKKRKARKKARRNGR